MIRRQGSEIDVELEVVFLLQLNSFRIGLRHFSLVVNGIQILHTLEMFEQLLENGQDLPDVTVPANLALQLHSRLFQWLQDPVVLSQCVPIVCRQLIVENGRAFLLLGRFAPVAVLRLPAHFILGPFGCLFKDVFVD